MSEVDYISSKQVLLQHSYKTIGSAHRLRKVSYSAYRMVQLNILFVFCRQIFQVHFFMLLFISIHLPGKQMAETLNSTSGEISPMSSTIVLLLTRLYCKYPTCHNLRSYLAFQQPHRTIGGSNILRDWLIVPSVIFFLYYFHSVSTKVLLLVLNLTLRSVVCHPIFFTPMFSSPFCSV